MYCSICVLKKEPHWKASLKFIKVSDTVQRTVIIRLTLDDNIRLLVAYLLLLLMTDNNMYMKRLIGVKLLEIKL